MFFPVFIQGLMISLSLIMAIGAQNAFVLRQGLRREHVGIIVIFCICFDALLMTAGVMGMARVLGESAYLARALTFVGFIFLVIYGWMALRRAQTAHQLKAAQGTETLSRGAALTQAAAFTLLNPHVYLDTVLLVGTIGAQNPLPSRWFFVMGAGSASALWFCVLGFGARLLAPWFAHPKAWQILDVLVGLTMWAIAAHLIYGLIINF